LADVTTLTEHLYHEVLNWRSDDLDGEPRVAEAKFTVLGDRLGFITAKTTDGMTFSVHVREVDQQGESVV
jgi:hypothetical protein